MTVFAERIGRLGTESAFEVLARANALEAEGKDIIHLEIGQPDFKTPAHIIEAAYEAMKNGYTGYSPTPGYPQVRKTISHYYREQKQVMTSPEEVVIVPGGKPIMFFTMLALIDPGDEVIYPNPGFPIYESCIRFAGGVPVPVPMVQEKNFRMSAEDLSGLITSRTKLVIINNPQNPTGGVMDAEDIHAIADVLADKNLYVLSDEIYDRLVFGEKKLCSIASIPAMKDKTIVLGGFSKAYAMTGWRIGYCVAPVDIAEKITLLMVNSNSCAASFTQMAAKTALEGPQECVEEMCGAYRERLTYLVNALNEIPGIECLMPGGSFYAFPKISISGMTDREFADRLLYEAGVAVLAGSAFGSYGAGHIRLSAATSMENIQKAVQKIGEFMHKLV